METLQQDGDLAHSLERAGTIAHSGLAITLQSPFYRCFLFISKSTYINIAKTNSLMLHFKGTLT